jgi:hypothetical protein
MVHNRPGLVTQDRRTHVGVRWQQATWVKEGDPPQKVVYTTQKNGKRQIKTRVGIGVPNTVEVREGGRLVGRFQPAGLFPEVVSYLYTQIAEVWKMDNEFAAKWASWAFKNEDNRDLKVLLAAFMLVQSRFGEPVQDGDSTFLDDDYRAVGEAMCLLRAKGQTFNPKLLRRIGEVLEVPGVVETNRRLGFGQSARSAVTGRYYKVVEKWLRHCDLNPKVLERLVKDGFRTNIMALCRKVGYKPTTERFFDLLRWKQVQSKSGHRTVSIGKAVSKADTWDELTEKQICEKIVAEQPNYKIIAGKLPGSVGLTPAIMAAAVEAGSLSDADLIIMTPTLEELGLLEDGDIQKRWKEATERAENQRAANIAKNVKSQAAQEGLEKAADTAAAQAVEEVTKDLRIYVIVDKSGSMSQAIDRAKEYCTKFIGAFPLDRLHVCVFNTVGVEVNIRTASAAGVAQAFRGHRAGGGTSYAAGAHCVLRDHPPKENEDALLIFIGDQQDRAVAQLVQVVRAHVDPVAFGLLHIVGNWGGGTIVEQAAAQLDIPCFKIEEAIFADPYAVPRTIRNLIAATPVKKAGVAQVGRPRVSLVDQILKTPLLQKPTWA